MGVSIPRVQKLSKPSNELSKPIQQPTPQPKNIITDIYYTDWSSLSKLVMNKERYEILKQYIKDNNFNDDIKFNIKKYVKTKAKEYNWVIKNDRLYVKTSNPRANKYDEITGKQLVRIDNEYFYYELIYSEKAPTLIKSIYNDPRTGSYRGIEALHSMISLKFIGIPKSMINEFLANHSAHQVQKQISQKVNQPLRPLYPNHWWQLDILYLTPFEKSNHKYKYVLTIIDIFSKFVWLRGLKSRESAEYGFVLEKLFMEFGSPKILQGDNEFRNQEVFNLKDFGITLRFGRAGNSASQGQVERVNRSIRGYINKHFETYNKTKWIELLPYIEFSLNCNKHSTTNQIPFEVYHGRSPPTSELLENLSLNLDDSKIDTELLSQNKEVRNQIEEAMDASVKKKLDKKASEMIKLDIESLPKIQVGDFVRKSVFLKLKYQERKKRNDHIRKYWSRKVFRIVESKLRDNIPYFKIQYPNGKIQTNSVGEETYISRQFLLLIDKYKLTSQQPEDVYKFYALGEDFDLQAYLKDKKKEENNYDPEILKEIFGDTDDDEEDVIEVPRLTRSKTMKLQQNVEENEKDEEEDEEEDEDDKYLDVPLSQLKVI